MTVRLNISEAGEWFRRAGKHMPETARRGLYGAALGIVQRLQNDPSLPKDRGIYRAGWRAHMSPGGAEVFNVSPQSLFIEQSVRATNVKPGRAMIDALAEWAKRKGLGVTYREGKGGSQRAIRPAADALRSLAWAIAKSMQKKGIFSPPKGLQPLAKTVRIYGPGLVRTEVAKAIKESFR